MNFKYAIVTNDILFNEREYLSTDDLYVNFINERNAGSCFADHKLVDLIEKKRSAEKWLVEMSAETLGDEEWIQLPKVSVVGDMSRYAVTYVACVDDRYKSVVFADTQFIHESLVAHTYELVDGRYVLKEDNNDSTDKSRAEDACEVQKETVAEETAEAVAEEGC